MAKAKDCRSCSFEIRFGDRGVMEAIVFVEVGDTWTKGSGVSTNEAELMRRQVVGYGW